MAYNLFALHFYFPLLVLRITIMYYVSMIEDHWKFWIFYKWKEYSYVLDICNNWSNVEREIFPPSYTIAFIIGKKILKVDSNMTSVRGELKLIYRIWLQC